MVNVGSLHSIQHMARSHSQTHRILWVASHIAMVTVLHNTAQV